MTADRWCLGWPPQPPHVPTDGLIEVRHPGSFRLCRRCWLRWSSSADDPEGQP